MIPLGKHYIILESIKLKFIDMQTTPLYLSMKPDEADQLVQLQTCLNDVHVWLSQNVSTLHSNETEVIIVGTK